MGYSNGDMNEVYNSSNPGVLPPAAKPAPKQPTNEGWKSILSTIGILLLAPALALFLMMFVVQPYEVDGPSMESTLQNHDRLIVLKLPRTIARVTHNDYLPNRGDVIIFNEPDSSDPTSASNTNKQLIKRVIGMPGDHVVVADGKLTVYNSEHPKGYSPDTSLPYGKVISSTPGDIDLVVPEGQIFVCGDNRSNSFDSRYFGTVPLHNVIGKLLVRVYPVGTIKLF